MYISTANDHSSCREATLNRRRERKAGQDERTPCDRATAVAADKGALFPEFKAEIHQVYLLSTRAGGLGEADQADGKRAANERNHRSIQQKTFQRT